MTDEEKRAEAAKKKREYRLRKKAEELAHQAPKEELTALFNEQARNIAPELIEQDHKDELADMLATAEERHRRVELIMSMYERDAANTNALLWHLIENIILMRLELTDLIGGLRNGK